MNRKILGLVFSFTLCFTLLFTYGVKADGMQNTRLGGFTRYDTNIKVVQQGWQKSDYAVLVGGENFPDALSAAPLAKKYNAPIFLVFPTGIDYRITDEFDRLGVKKVFIIGGTNIIPTLTEDTLKSKGISYERIYGQNRYETSIDIANKIGTSKGVIVTTGNDYPDALSIAPIAGKLQIPIILSQRDALTSIQKKFVSSNTIPATYVIGGTDLISDNVASKFPNIQRIATENNRFDRNLDIINSFKNNIDFSNVVLASGADFPDALSGSALAALNCNPVILVGQYSQFDYKETANNSLISTLLGNNGTKNLYTLGMSSSISDDDLNSIIGQSSALETINSKIKLNSNLKFGNVGSYSYDGSNYYRIALYDYNKTSSTWTTDYYQYDFLVDKETGDTYKIDNSTNEISPLDITSIGDNTSTPLNSALTINQALELVKSKVKLDVGYTLDLPYVESERTTMYNGDNYYVIIEDYDDDAEIYEYLVDVKTGKIIKHTQDQYIPIN